MNTVLCTTSRSNSRLQIVLGFPVALVIEIVDRKIEVHAMPNSPGHAEINNVEAGRVGNSRVRAVQ